LKRERKQTVYHANGSSSERDTEYFMTTERPTAHVSWSKIVNDHVDAYVPKAGVNKNWAPPSWLKKRQKKKWQ